MIKEYEDKLNELQSKISTISRKQTTMVLQKEALTYERDVSRRKIPRKPNKAVKKRASRDKQREGAGVSEITTFAYVNFVAVYTQAFSLQFWGAYEETEESFFIWL